MKKSSNHLTSNLNYTEYKRPNNANITPNNDIISVNFSSRNPQLFSLYNQLNGITEKTINNTYQQQEGNLTNKSYQEIENIKTNDLKIFTPETIINKFPSYIHTHVVNDNYTVENYSQQSLINNISTNTSYFDYRYPFQEIPQNFEFPNYLSTTQQINVVNPNERQDSHFQYTSSIHNSVPMSDDIQNSPADFKNSNYEYKHTSQQNLYDPIQIPFKTNADNVDEYIRNLIQTNQYTYYNNSKFNLVEIQEKNYIYVLKQYKEYCKDKSRAQENNNNQIPFLYVGFYKDTNDIELMNWLKTAPLLLKNDNAISTYTLPPSENIHCILHNNTYFITGTDIVKLVLWYLNSTGCFISNLKKFEEGIFSDLRSLKVGLDSILESPRSKFLEFLYKKGCVRTQKKQKVFKYNSVNINKIYSDALERELRRGNGVFSSLCLPEYSFTKQNILKYHTDPQNIDMHPFNEKTNMKDFRPKNLDDVFSKINTEKGNIFEITGEFSNLLSRDEDTTFFTDL